MFNLINVTEESLDVHVDKCYRGNFLCVRSLML